MNVELRFGGGTKKDDRHPLCKTREVTVICNDFRNHERA